MSGDVSLATPIGAPATSCGPALTIDQRFVGRLITFAIYCLPILTFTTPGRPSPSSLAFLDGLAMVKLVVLLIVFFSGASIIIAMFYRDSRRSLRSIAPLIPFILFGCWGVFSVLWSPLPAVTVGQAGGLFSQLVLATLLALTCHDRTAVEQTLKTLSIMLLGFSLFVLSVHLVAPEFSGLDRVLLRQGSDGVVHPTAAGANSSLGLMVVALCYFVCRYDWAYRMLLASVLIHGAVVFYASSRTALGMALVTIPIILFLNTSNQKRALMIFAAALLAIVFVVFDPGFQSILDSDSVGVQYITRGQDANQLKGVSGRAEMWAKVWQEYTKSPVIGHGYFISSETGALEVWYSKANHTAHNIYLQILVSTGLIGFVLFAVAILKPFLAFQTFRNRDILGRRVFQCLIFVCIWYLGWSLFCASFMGPVRSESVVFFTFLGIGVGQLARLANAQESNPAAHEANS